MTEKQVQRLSSAALVVWGLAFPALVPAQAGGLVGELIDAFQEVHPLLDRVTVLEVHLVGDHLSDERDLRYIVLAHAVRSDLIPGDPDAEQFGVFEVADDLVSVTGTLGTLRSPRWLDYTLRIDSIDEEVVLVGEGATYGDHPIRWVVALEDDAGSAETPALAGRRQD